MKRFSLVLCILFSIPFSGNSQVVETIIPDTVYVCPDTFQVVVYVVNNIPGGNPMTNLEITHGFEAGINLVNVDSLANTTAFNLINPNAPIFQTNALAFGDTAKLYLTVQVDCDFPNSQAVNTTTITYDLLGSPQSPSPTVSSSYNILKPSLNLSVTNNANVVANMADTVEREVTICNNGFQVINELTLFADPSADIIRCQYNLQGSAGSVLITDTSSIVLIDSALLMALTGDNFLGLGECIIVTETVKVDSCTGAPTTYTASYSCGNMLCQSSFDDATVNVVPGNPLVDIIELPGNAVQTSYCDSTLGHLSFEYQGNGADATGIGVPSGNSYATDLKIHFRYTKDFVNVKDATIAGVSVASLVASFPAIDDASWQYSGRDSIYVIDLSLVNVDFAPGIIFDLDNDGFYDDLPNDSTFLVDVDFEIECDPKLQECPLLYGPDHFFIMNVGAGYKDQCGGAEEVFGITTGDGIKVFYVSHAEDAVMVLPPDVFENTPFTLEVCPVFSQSYGGDFTYEMPCNDDSLVAVVYLPLGYTLPAGADSITITYNITTSLQDTIRVPLVLSNDTLFIPIGSIPAISIECFDVPLDFICTGNPILLTNGSIPDEFNFELQYVCEEGCGCREVLSCGTESTFHHCLGACGSPVQTASFSVERNSFGWADAPSYTKSARAIAPRVNRTTPGIRLDAAYPCDSICAVAIGSIQNVSSVGGADSVFVQLRYQAPADSLVFDFLSGTFEIHDSNGALITTCSAVAPVVSDSGAAPNKMYFLDFYVPTSCMPSNSWTALDSITAKINLRYKKSAAQELFGNGHGYHFMDKFRAEYMLIDLSGGDTILSCDHFGSNFTLLKPYTGISYYSPTAACNELPVQFRHQTNPGFKALDLEDFPNEFRNSIAIQDTIDIHLPTGWKYVMASAAYSFNNGNIPFGNQVTTSITPNLILSDNYGDTMLRLIRDWELTDCYLNTVQSNFQTIKFRLQPTCVAVNGPYTTTANHIRQHYSDAACFDSLITVYDVYPSSYQAVHNTPGLNIPPISDVLSVKNIITWDFQYCNTLSLTNTDADFTWLGIENPSADLQLIDVLLNGVTPLPSFAYGPPGSSKLFVQVDTLLLDNTCLNLTLVAKNLNCDNINELDSVIVFGGYDCLAFPDNPDSTSCGDTLATFRFTVEPVSIAMIAAVPTSQNLCESSVYTLSVTNTDVGSLCDPVMYFDLPNGFVLDSATYTYPTYTGTPTLLPLPTTGFGQGGLLDGWSMDPIAFSNLGLTGVGDTSTNKMEFTFYITPICGVTSNDFITFNFAGINTCSDTLTETFQTLPLVLNGINGMISTSVNLQADDIQACDSVAVISVTVTNTGTAPSGTDDSFVFSLADNLNYNNQFAGIKNPPIVTSPTQVGNNGLTSLTWDLPSGIAPGDSSVFTFEIVLTDSSGCGPFEFLGASYASDSLYCATTSDSCWVSVAGDSTSIIINVDPPSAQFTIPATICVNDTLFVNSTSCGNSEWDFGDGNTSVDSASFNIYGAAGTYFVTHIITSPCGSDTLIQSVTVGSPTITISNDTTICEGSCVTLQATGGVSYSWTPVAAVNNPNSPNPTTCPGSTTLYVVEVTDSNGCVGKETITVSVIPSVTVNAGPDQTICIGNSTTLAGSGTGPFYSWSPTTGLNNPSIPNPVASPTVTTQYVLTVTNDLGCSATDSMTVFVNPLPDASFTFSGDTCMASPVFFTSNDPSGSHLWDFGDAGNSTSVNPSHTYSSANTFLVFHYMSNACGTDVDSAYVEMVDCDPTPCIIDLSLGEDVTICPGECTQLNAYIAGAVSYVWTPSIGLNNSSVYNPIACPTVTTQYTVVVTDDAGCIAADSITVTVQNIVADAGLLDTVHVCSNNLPQSIALGGSPTGPAGTTCTWSNSPFPWLVNNANFFSPSPNDCNPSFNIPALNLQSQLCINFVVTVTDTVTGCKDSDTVVVCLNPRMTLSIDSLIPTCEGACDASATVIVNGGDAPYTYQWNDPSAQTTATASGLCPGTYTVLVVDANGCSESTTVTITYVIPPTIFNLPAQVCTTDPPFLLWASGSVSGNGTFTSSCSPSGILGPINIWNLSLWAFFPAQSATGNCMITYTNDAGCSTSHNIVVEVCCDQMVLTTSSTSAICSANCNGSATVAVTGGSGTYAYLWDDPAGQTTATASGLCPGTYSVVVTDIETGCTEKITVTVESKFTPKCTFVNGSYCVTEPPVFMKCKGNGVFSGPGVTGSNPAIFDPSLAGVGTHTIAFTKPNGCTYTFTVIVFGINQCFTGGGDNDRMVSQNEEPFESLFYPNPATNTAVYEYSGLSKGGTFELVTVLGEVLFSKELSDDNGNFSIDLSTLPSGVYLYRVTADDKILDRDRVVIAR